MRGFLKGGPGRAASTFVVTLFLVLAVMACQGPAGTPGVDGKAGPKGDPGATPTAPTPDPVLPTTVGEIAPIRLQVGWHDTVDVEDNFKEPQGQPLTYFATTNDSSIATVMRAGGSVFKVTGVKVGMATVTVTATDSEKGKSPPQTFKVTVDSRVTLATVGTIDNVPTYAGDMETVDVRSAFNIHDPRMMYEAASKDELRATVEVEGSVVTVNALRPTGSGGVLITVTATDPGGAMKEQVFATIIKPASEKPMEPEEPEEPEEPMSTYADCEMLVLDGEDDDKKCTLTLMADYTLQSADSDLVKVTPPKANAASNEWTVEAVKKTGKDGVEIQVVHARVKKDQFTVVVPNQRPVRTSLDPGTRVYSMGDIVYDADGDPIAPGAGAVAWYYGVNVNVAGYFTDNDEADLMGDGLKYRAVVHHDDVIVRDGGVSASLIVLDVLQEPSGDSFDITLYAIDSEKEESDPVTIKVAPLQPQIWIYPVEQDATSGSFTNVDVGLRVGVTHNLAFDVGDAPQLVFVDMATTGGTLALTADNTGNELPPETGIAAAATFVKITRASGPIKIEDPTVPGPLHVPFEMTLGGTAKIKFEYFIAADDDDGVPKWGKPVATNILTLNIVRDVPDDAAYSFR